MKLLPIVQRIKDAKTLFGDRVAGAAEVAYVLYENKTLTGTTAFVIPLGESVTDNITDGSVLQYITERFGVIVGLRNGIDPKDVYGLKGFDSLQQIRAQIFKALLGWEPDVEKMSEISYAGGRLLQLDRVHLWYQYEFAIERRITTKEDGYDNNMSSLDDLNTVSAQIVPPGGVVPTDGVLPSPIVPSTLDTLVQADFGFDSGFGVGFNSPVRLWEQ